MFALLLVASLFATDPAPVDKRCEPLPSPLRVRVSVGEQWKDAAPVIRKLVEDTWTPTGVNIEWIDGGLKWDGVDLWIAVVPGLMVTGRNGSPASPSTPRSDGRGSTARGCCAHRSAPSAARWMIAISCIE